MFASIARRYDRANTILSAGVHHRWRREAVIRSGAKPGDEVLDCATGTGDLAIAFRRESRLRECRRHRLHSRDDRACAREGAVDPIRSRRCDGASVRRRQLRHRQHRLRHSQRRRSASRDRGDGSRVAKKIVILEFGQPRSKLLAAFYRFYCRELSAGLRRPRHRQSRGVRIPRVFVGALSERFEIRGADAAKREIREYRLRAADVWDCVALHRFAVTHDCTSAAPLRSASPPRW